jgi:hypothetical protein
MTRQRRFEALYTAQRAAEVNRQLKQYMDERRGPNSTPGRSLIPSGSRKRERLRAGPAAEARA